MMTVHLARRFLRRGSILLVAGATGAGVWAQASGDAPSDGGASEPVVTPTPNSVSERVKKDAAGPLYWIRLNAQRAESARAEGAAKPALRITEVRPAKPAPTAAAAGPSSEDIAAARAAAVRAARRTAAANALAANGATPGGPAAGETGTVASAPATPRPQLDAAPLATSNALPEASANAAVGALATPSLLPSSPSATDLARAAATTAAGEAEADEDDTPLAVLQADEPDFPGAVMRRLRKGAVQVRFDVQPDGGVANPTVVETSNRGLNEAALQAVAAWKFQPVRQVRTAIVELAFDLDS